MRKEIILKGKIVESLLKGSTIVKHWCGEFTVTILIQNPKDSEWKFTMFQNILESTNGNPNLIEAINYNYSKREAIKACEDDHYSDEFHAMQQAKKKSV